MFKICKLFVAIFIKAENKFPTHGPVELCYKKTVNE